MKYKVPFDCFKKLDRKGYCRCVVCDVDLSYAKGGSGCLLQHVKTSFHMDRILLRRSNNIIEATEDALVVASNQHIVDLKDRINHYEDDEKGVFKQELNRYIVDDTLPPFSIDERIDSWRVEQSLSYPILTKIALAISSAFSGPHVEGSFSVMTEVLSLKAGRRSVNNYGALQSVKYLLRAEGKSAVQRFQREKLTDQVDKSLITDIRAANSRWKAQHKRKQEARQARLDKLEIKKRVSEKTALTTNPRKRVYSDSKKNDHREILANGLEDLRKHLYLQ